MSQVTLLLPIDGSEVSISMKITEKDNASYLAHDLVSNYRVPIAFEDSIATAIRRHQHRDQQSKVDRDGHGNICRSQEELHSCAVDWASRFKDEHMEHKHHGKSNSNSSSVGIMSASGHQDNSNIEALFQRAYQQVTLTPALVIAFSYQSVDGIYLSNVLV